MKAYIFTIKYPTSDANDFSLFIFNILIIEQRKIIWTGYVYRGNNKAAEGTLLRFVRAKQGRKLQEFQSGDTTYSIPVQLIYSANN